MSIDRVPKVPFAQIANGALRDKRLSYKARGILAMVLSHSGEWNASRDFIESQSEVDGRTSVQSALDELTQLGYRLVKKEQRPDGTWETWVEWFHESADRRPADGKTGGRETRRSVRPAVYKNTIEEEGKPPVTCPYCREIYRMDRKHNCGAMNMSF